MENATIYFDAIDVMEVSSNFTNGRELSGAEAKDWMIKHCELVEDRRTIRHFFSDARGIRFLELLGAFVQRAEGRHFLAEISFEKIRASGSSVLGHSRTSWAS
jgi:hypothetical protein